MSFPMYMSSLSLKNNWTMLIHSCLSFNKWKTILRSAAWVLLSHGKPKSDSGPCCLSTNVVNCGDIVVENNMSILVSKRCPLWNLWNHTTPGYTKPQWHAQPWSKESHFVRGLLLNNPLEMTLNLVFVISSVGLSHISWSVHAWTLCQRHQLMAFHDAPCRTTQQHTTG